MKKRNVLFNETIVLGIIFLLVAMSVVSSTEILLTDKNDSLDLL